MNTFDFVCEHYGPAAHVIVLQMLPASPGSLDAVQEASWIPAQELVAYMETAKAVLAPGDPDFYRKIGLYGGGHDRAVPAGITVSERATALRLYPMLWRTFFDAGDLEVIEACPEGAILRIHHFPSAPPLCQRLIGSVEGFLSRMVMPVRVEERACVCRGDPYCEMLVAQGPSWQGSENWGYILLAGILASSSPPTHHQPLCGRGGGPLSEPTGSTGRPTGTSCRRSSRPRCAPGRW